MHLNEEDGLKIVVLLSRIQRLFQVLYIHRMLGCLFFIYLFIYLLILLEKSQDAFPYNATYIQRLQLKSRALPFSMQ